MIKSALEEVSKLLLSSRRTMALTGAGISAESEIPTFRGIQGLWQKYDIMEYAHIEAFRRDPVKVWQMLLELDETITRAQPNPAHYALAELEKMELLHLIVTQNVDNLHQTAGSREVVEFHGNSQKFVCLGCQQTYQRQEIDFQKIPPRCFCGELIKPAVVFFGEAIPWAANLKAFDAARDAEVVLVVGTSATVAPAGEIPVVAKQAGATVVEINIEETQLTDYVSDFLIKGSASEILPQLIGIINKSRQ